MSRILLAMSGGVDSSVAAYILKEQGHDVIGATIKTWSSDECRDERVKGCCSIQDVGDARSVAGKLGIPFYVLDLSADFKEKVIDNFIESYLDAKTPNPCIQCNNHIKFGIFLRQAEALNVDFVATGHYARRAWDEKTQRWYIREGRDLTKDQSYVLFGLSQEQISKTLLPVGDYHKIEIRKMAEAIGLNVHDKPDSQEICFVSKHYSQFIQKQGIELPGKGDLVDVAGKILGQHEGYHLYTIGQRKRILVTDKTPYYVVRIDRDQNRVIVGKKEDLKSFRMTVEKVNWMRTPNRKDYQVKIRSRHTKSQVRLVEYSNDEALIEFYEGESAVTPGQAAVLYEDDGVIGGGWIQKTYSQ